MFWNHCLLAAQKLLRYRTCWTSSVLASHLLGATGGDRRTKPSCFGRIGWLKWMFFFVCFFHTYIHTKWVSFLVNVPCLAIKTVCLDLWCWELNAHYWCKYCFCFPFRLEGTRPVTLEQMLIFCLRDWLHTPTRVSQPPYNSVPPWQQWVSEDIPRGKHMWSDPAPSPPSILLHLHRVYGVRDTQVSNLWVNLSPCEGKMLSCFLHHFSHNSEVCNYSMHFFLFGPES